MYKSVNRDLLVVSKQAQLNDDALQHEIEVLNELLYDVEMPQNLALACEIINVNRYRIIRKPEEVSRVLNEKVFPSFVFVFNKN